MSGTRGGELMSKLIEVPDDFIVREPVMDGAKRVGTRNIDLSFMPSVDLVRCWECKFYREFRTKRYNQLMCMCYRMGKHDMEYPVKSDDFCSYGQRKEADHD